MLNMYVYIYIYTYSCIYIYIHIYTYIWASLVAQIVKNLPAMQETQVPSLGQEDPLEERMATHSSFLAWRIPWTEEPSGLQSMWSQRVRHDWATKVRTHTHSIQEWIASNIPVLLNTVLFSENKDFLVWP